MKFQACYKSFIAFLILLLISGMSSKPWAQTSFIKKLQGQQTAAVVYALNSAAERFKKNALSRIEGILLDNGVLMLDKKKAEELKDVFKTLNDPGAFVTAETFIENAEKLAIKGLIGVYLSVDAKEGLAEYFSATAHADVRYISEEDARVESLTTRPMGSPGRPPSDGLTKNSAILNAVQRAVDDVSRKLGMEIMDPVTPRSVKLTLEGPVQAPVSLVLKRTSTRNPSLSRFAHLEKKQWRGEDVTCTAKAPAGSLGAVGGYIIDTDFRRRPPRLYGSRIHLIDLQSNQEILAFTCHPVEKKASEEKGTRRILDCMFVSNWRYLSAITGNNLFLWDTERGSLQTSVPLHRPLKKAELRLGKSEDGSYLIVVQAGKKQLNYKIVRKK